MLDRWFISKLNPTGRIAYFVGQIGFLIVLGGLMFGVLGMSWREAQGLFILGAIVFIVGWGFLCRMIWPITEEPPR